MKQYLQFLFSFVVILTAQSQTIGIVGPAANGWPSDDNPTDIMLTDNGDGTHSIDALTLTTGPAKFRENQAWTTSYGGDVFPSGSITNGDIPVQAGVYDVVLDLNTNTYTFTDVSTFTEIELVGSAVVGSNPTMSTIDGENYELSVTEFGDGDLLFQEVGTANTFGADSFPNGTATSDGTDIPVQFGFYEVSFNLTTGDYTFTIPDVGIVGPAANGWPDGSNPTPDIPMNSTDGDVYALNSQVLNDGALKFRQNFDWSVNWGGDSFPSGSFTGDDILVTAGTYDISFFRANQTYTFTSLSVEDLSFENFNIYPNPAKDRWVFENPSTPIESINIYNTFGKMIHQAKPNSTTGYVNAQTFEQGIYLAKIKLSDNSETTVKIIKR